MLKIERNDEAIQGAAMDQADRRASPDWSDGKGPHSLEDHQVRPVLGASSALFVPFRKVTSGGEAREDV